MIDKKSPLYPDAMYHVYNRANGNEKLFLSENNYSYFLKRYAYFISPIADLYSYCLMPNHFHFLIKIKSKNEIIKNLNTHFPNRYPNLNECTTIELVLSKQFSNFFSSYTQAFNKQQKRMGSLFMKNFNRILITSDKQLLNVVVYIHQNPVAASFCTNIKSWKFSSYNPILAANNSIVCCNEVVNLFNDLDNFIYCHSSNV